MATPPKKPRPGIFTDPWRTSPSASVPPPKEEVSEPKELSVTPAISEDNAQNEGIKRVQILLVNYGGITVTGTDSSPEAAKIILEFCINHLKNIENILLQYGIVVVKLKPTQETNAIFYIRRSDGWILAIPEARTRNQGLLQLIQAFLALQANTHTKSLMQDYHIQPHKI
jgi:hypothetical protein